MTDSSKTDKYRVVNFFYEMIAFGRINKITQLLSRLKGVKEKNFTFFYLRTQIFFIERIQQKIEETQFRTDKQKHEHCSSYG